MEVTELGAQYWGVEITTINILVSTLGSLYIYMCTFILTNLGMSCPYNLVACFVDLIL